MKKQCILLAQDDNGSAALQFLRGQVTKVPSNSAVPILISLTHFALNNQQTNAREYLNQPEVWQEIQKPFEIYRLEDETYQLQIGEPLWMPEVGLGLGRGRQVVGGIEQEVLLWHDAQGQAYPLSEQVIEELRQQVQRERQRAERLAEHLRSLEVDPDSIA